MVYQDSFYYNLNRWDKIMKTYTDKLVVNMKAEVAWEALKIMDRWLPSLSTNQAIYFEGGEDFFYEGRKYHIVTKEGIKMSCEISGVNEEAFWIEIHARHSLLHSILNCQVIPLTSSTCQLVRTQSYPGFVGFLFNLFFKRREAGETSEYLEVWKNYAQNQLQTL